MGIRLGAFACALVWATAVSAQASEPLSFIDAARKTLAAHPQFERLALALEAAQTRKSSAALRPPVEIASEVENASGSGTLQGFDAAEITLSVGSVFERGDKRQARIQAASQAIELLSIEQRIAALDLLAETGRRFVALAAAQEAVVLAQGRARQAQRTLEFIVPRVTAARSPPTEQLNAEIDLAASELALGDAQRELEAARLALASQWSEPTDTPTVTAGLYTLPEPRSFEALTSDLERLPDLVRFSAEARVREAQLRLARAQAVADWRWSAGVRHLQALDEQALVLGFSMPLGAGARSAPLVREAELERAQIPLSAEARRLELVPLLYSQWQALRSAREAARVLTAEQLPRAREALELTERGYRIGRFAYRELAIVQQQLLALEAQRLQAAARYHLTRIEIERLTGAQLALVEGLTR